MLDVLRVSPDGLVAADDWWRQEHVDRAFGGQLVAHCIRAAAAKAPSNTFCHSCHIHFLRGGMMVETKYVMEPLRIGKSYSVFKVRAIETAENRLLVEATVSFHTGDEHGPELHSAPLPDQYKLSTEDAAALAANAALPGSSPSSSSSYKQVSLWPRAVPAAKPPRARWYLLPWQGGDGSGGKLDASSSHDAHAAALAFLSDYVFLWSAHAARHQATYHVAFLTSLDHTIHIHCRSFDASGPLLYEADSPYAAAGRAVVRGRLWDALTGQLLATTMQEGVLRVVPAAKL